MATTSTKTQTDTELAPSNPDNLITNASIALAEIRESDSIIDAIRGQESSVYAETDPSLLAILMLLSEEAVLLRQRVASLQGTIGGRLT
jgi:hypothetical protein